MKAVSLISLLIAMCFISGCGTFVVRLAEIEPTPRPWPAMRSDIEFGQIAPIPFILALVDVPFSLVSDTLLLPYDLYEKQRIAAIPTTSYLPSSDTYGSPPTVFLSLNSDGVQWQRETINYALPEKRPAIGAVVRSRPDFQGVLVESIKPNEPAAIAGILAGDVITRIDGVDVKSVTDFLKRVADSSGAVDMTVQRSGISKNLKVMPKKMKLGVEYLHEPQWKTGSQVPCALANGSHVLMLRFGNDGPAVPCIVTVKSKRAGETVVLNKLSALLVKRAADGEVLLLSVDSLSGESHITLAIGGRHNPASISLKPPNITVRTLFPRGFSIDNLGNDVLTTCAQKTDTTFTVTSAAGLRFAAFLKVGEVKTGDIVGRHEITISDVDIQQMKAGNQLTLDLIGCDGNCIATLAMERN